MDHVKPMMTAPDLQVALAPTPKKGGVAGVGGPKVNGLANDGPNGIVEPFPSMR